MIEKTQDLAIVLRATRFEERHLIVSALTQNHGKITAMAKNAIHSRRFGGTLAPFAASEWTFSRRAGAELYSLTETHLRRSYEGVAKDLNRLSFASACNELCLKILSQDHPCPEMFKLHAHALALFEDIKHPEDLLPIFNAVLIKWLVWNGHQPRLDLCLGCQKPLGEPMLQPEPVHAGFKCASCANGLETLTFPYAAWIDALNAGHLPLTQIIQHRQGTPRDQSLLFAFLKSTAGFHVHGLDGFLKSLDTVTWSDLQSNGQHPGDHFQQNPPAPG